MSSIDGRCPACGDSGPLKIVKEDDIEKWGVSCWMCGVYFGEGSYAVAERDGDLNDIQEKWVSKCNPWARDK